jgi:SAM-dependent methyltransferase
MAGLAWALAGVTALIAIGSCALALWHVLAIRRVGTPPAAPVTLILAITGDQPGLASLFDALAAQRFRARRLLVAVESRWDPAAAQAEALVVKLPFPLEVIVAGEASETAQKCANLAAAFRALDGGDAAAVVLDGDIRPGPGWLGALVGPILDGRYDIVTGYRWLMPGAGGVSAQLTAWLDRGAAILPKLPALGLIWGGSTAYSPAALARLDLPDLYARQLSDDLSAGARARALGLRVLTRRILLVQVPGEGRGLGFYRRQFQFGWRYLPATTTLTLVLALLTPAGWWAAAALVFQGVPLATALMAAMLAGRLGQWAAQRRIAAVLEAPDPPRTARRQLAVALLAPLATLALPLAMLAALPARRITWRGIRYRVRGPERIAVTQRVPWEKPPPCPVTGADGSVRVGTLPVGALWPLWRWALGTAPTPLTRGTRIGCWRSPAGLVFFHPLIEGDAAFYTTLYRRNRFGELAREWAGARVEFIEAARHIAPGEAVLELGAGTGGFRGHLPEGARYMGLDPHAGDYAAGAIEGVVAEALADHVARRAGTYDAACAFQVIEHVADPLGTARTLLDALRPGGRLILVAPLWPSPLTRIPNFPINLPPHHLTWWSPEAFRALAAVIGAEVVEARPIPSSPHVGRLQWMARLSPLRVPDAGPWLQARWSWHLALLASALFARIATWMRPVPPDPAPIDVMLVARKPSAPAGLIFSDAPAASAAAARGGA